MTTHKRTPSSIYEAMADASAASIIESLQTPRLDITDSESEDGLNYDEILNRYASVADQFSIIRCQALLRKCAEVMKVKKMLACIPKRNGTAREVLDTEVKYIENLEQVVEVYIKPLRADANNKGQLINKDDLKTLFSELEVILAYAKSLKSRIKERVEKWFPTQIIGDIFVQMIDFFKIYTQYCTNYPKAMETLERCKKNSSFVNFLQEREQASGVIIPIENFLIMPVQRIPRYALLVDELMRNTWESHPDYDNLKKALVRIQEVAEFVNEQKRYKENFARILEIYNSLIGIKTEAKQDMLILQKNIWFLREGSVLELMMKGSLTKFHIFLFNGMMLWTKPSKGTFEFKKMTPIDPQTKVEIRTTDEGYKMIHLTTSQGLFVFKTDSAEDAESWFNKFNESKNFVTPVMERKEEKSNSNPGSMSPSPSVTRKEEMSPSPSFSHNRSSSIGSAATLAGSKSSPGIARSSTPKKNRSRAGTNSLVLTGGTNRLLELKEQEEADLSVNQKIEEETKFIKEWEALDDSPELDKFSVDANEIKAAFEDTSSDTFAQYSAAIRAAQSMNVTWDGPEVVLIGKKGEGRTSVLEALLGHHIAGSCRPLFIHLINNPKRATARIVLKKDSSLKSAHFFNDVEVRPEELDVEIMSRSKVFSLVPIHIHYEHKSVWDMTIIDPPGVASFNIFDEWYQFNLMSKASIKNSQDDVSQIKDYIIDLAKKESRLLIFVEESKEPSVMSINRIAKQLDPQMTRSVFVNTKFHYKLRDMIDFNDVNSYFNLTNVNAAKTFWVSLVKRRPRNSTNEYRRKMVQTQKRDLQLLEDLQYDRKIQSQVGVVTFRNYIMRDIEKRFKEAIPGKLSQIQQLITKTYAKYEAIDHALQHINVNTARIRANEFVNTFVSNFNKLMTGTLEMELKIGMSLRREHEEFGGWINGDNQPIIFDSKSVKRYKERLYGNPQLIRMVAVFEQIVKTLQFDSAEIDKNLATATKTSLNQIANEVVIAKTSRHYAPLVTQLCAKLTACLKNTINAAYATARGSIARSGNILQDTLLLSHVKNLFEDAIEKLSETAVTKCLNELKLAQVFSTHSFSIEGIKHSKSADVADLIEEVLSRIAKQFVGSVSLQIYDTFVYSGLKEVTTQLTVKVASLSEEQLSQFGELNNIKLQKEHEQKTIFAEIKRLQEAHDALYHASQKFIEQNGNFIHTFLPEAIQSLLKHTKSSAHIKV